MFVLHHTLLQDNAKKKKVENVEISNEEVITK